MRKVSLSIFLIMYFLGGCFVFFAPTIGYGGKFVKMALRHGFLRQVWISTNEAYLKDTYLYIKGIKRVDGLRNTYKDKQISNNEDMYLKYDLTIFRVTGKERNPIDEISGDEYYANKNNDTLFKFLEYRKIYEILSVGSKCSEDIFYNYSNKYIFADGDTMKSQNKYILVTNEYGKAISTKANMDYGKDCRYTVRGLETSLSSSRDSSSYPVFMFKLVGGLILDFLTWPLQFLTAVFSPGW